MQPSRRPEPESPAAKGTPKSARRAISIDISGKQIGGICLILFGAMLLCWGGFNLFVEQVIPWIKVAGAIIMGLFWMNLGWGLLQKR